MMPDSKIGEPLLEILRPEVAELVPMLVTSKVVTTGNWSSVVKL